MRKDININLRPKVTIEHLWQGGVILALILIAIGGFFSASVLSFQKLFFVGSQSPTKIEAYVSLPAIVLTGIGSRLIQRKLKQESEDGKVAPPGIE